MDVQYGGLSIFLKHLSQRWLETIAASMERTETSLPQGRDNAPRPRMLGKMRGMAFLRKASFLESTVAGIFEAIVAATIARRGSDGCPLHAGVRCAARLDRVIC